MPLTLLLAFHNHQPDGNFDEVFAQAHADCYVRILDELERAPHVKCALHHTGALLEWLDRHQPKYLDRLRALVERGQVEILGGGFYEPMLAVLPERDAIGQIRMMSDWCHRRLGVRPTGMWLAERVWEPGLPQLLEQAQVKFTLIDDNHFRSAGMTGALRGYYATEKAGHATAIFPIEQKLRYAIPFASPEETIATLARLAKDTPPGYAQVVTYGDDGEKFGLWPGTMEWVWGKGWLRKFFALLGEHQDTVTTSHFGTLLKTTPSSGRVYLPTASYEEMGEWALPCEAQHIYLDVRHDLEERKALDKARPFLRGGIWQGFLAKYPEANLMHKKMVRVSGKVAAAIEKHPGRESENRQMVDDLYRAQCNCSYWHGLFGGLYLNYLRDTVYRHLLVAEAFADAQLGRPAPAWAPNADPALAGSVIAENVDVDGDLAEEIVVQSSGLDVMIRPHEGGAVEELAYRPKTFTLTNVLGRHEEGYHQKLREYLAPRAPGKDDDSTKPKSIHDIIKVKEPGLDRHLIYDRYRRLCFVDHFFGRGATLTGFSSEKERDLGDFAGARYTILRPPRDAIHQAVLERIGTVDGRTVRVLKTIAVGERVLTVGYVISQQSGPPLDVLFAPELSLTLLDGNSQERVYEFADRALSPEERVLSSRGELRDVAALALVNHANKFRVDLRFRDRRPTVWRFPLETVSNSEAGFERTYQGSVITPLFELALTVGAEPAAITIDVELSDI